MPSLAPSLYRFMDEAVEPGDALSGFLARLRFRARSVQSSALGLGDRRSFGESAAAGASRAVVLHHVATGSASLSAAGSCTLVRAGDVVVLPQGGPHTVTALDDTDVLTVTLHPDAAVATVVGGLPALMMACALALHESLVASLLTQLRTERMAGRPGSETLVAGLAELVAAAAIRSLIESGCASGTAEWMLTLRDPHIARAVEAIHADPGSAWTVAALARLASSSRSVFAEQFRLTVGEPPLGYLARVRMERAKELLGREGLGVGQTAAELGYRSDEAFSRAFRRAVGTSPSQWRRAGGGRPGPVAIDSEAAGAAPLNPFGASTS